MSSDHSSASLINEKTHSILGESSTRGSQRIKYQEHSDWDFHLDAGSVPVDLSLILPHYRARHQPLDHRMSMFVSNQSRSMKLKVCRNNPHSKFILEAVSSDADITIWLPSDFRGSITHTGKAKYSAGFVNRILRHAHINEADGEKSHTGDEVVVATRGTITFRMWDIQTFAPEKPHLEAIRRLFACSCSRKAPEMTIDWDFLLND